MDTNTIVWKDLRFLSTWYNINRLPKIARCQNKTNDRVGSAHSRINEEYHQAILK